METDGGDAFTSRAQDHTAQATWFRVLSKHPRAIKGAASDAPVDWKPNEVVVAQTSILYGIFLGHLTSAMVPQNMLLR